MCAGMRIIMKKSRLIIMDIIIVILVVLNAAMIIAVTENYNDENRTYNTRWFMNLYKNDEYGRAVDYASRDKIVIDNIQDNELDESIAVAEYYNAEFYKNVYKTMGNTQKLKQMEEQSDMALKRMGSLSILKQKIDSIVNVPDRQTK
jgi:hypothetical protein